MANRDIEERLRRLERFEVLAFCERHGLNNPALIPSSVGALRAQVAQDCASIIREHQTPVEMRS